MSKGDSEHLGLGWTLPEKVKMTKKCNIAFHCCYERKKLESKIHVKVI